MSNIVKKFKVENGKGFKLGDFDPAYSDGFKKIEARKTLKDLIDETFDLQTELYAANKYALLIIFQAMDAAGKDSAIEHTLSGLNPQGCQVYSFKQPSTEDYEHDFLWRHYRSLPERGRIGIHNRSHYENVLVTKVHPDLLLKEHLPGINDVKDIDGKFWDKRYESIRAFEKHLTDNGTVIIKFYLNVSKQEQKLRFLKRIDNPKKNWKFSAADIEERKKWADYMDAYEKAIKETATNDCPWYVIPADKKWFTRIAISSVILDTLKGLKLKYPVLEKEEKDKLDESKKQLEKE
ncbi:polyphosphate kinase 2 family protein [Mucilaginibacter ginsenosidivorax]|uniref:Polyphosphate kinase 2 family protein n=2 Tax=Mucilaginibacter ginsenosidivorax TaxID=862126 RepID=A0A5B8WBZ8_9SPHI|nr:polyphosphate kinase 2 family protein [Mucilaginibacter ginsenosidivorax]QEC80336.1 polyphosphate kinase 2 family protein [Mucilaginibacter ginsenosidivorax]